MIVGLTGPNAAGKGRVAEILAGRGFEVISLSDIVREEARARGLPPVRETLIALGREIREREGPGALAERVLPRLGDRVVVDSIRSPAEVAVLRRRRDFRLLGVDAPVELRWRRAVARARAGERPGLAEFRAREAEENRDDPNSQQLARTLALADRVVVNDGSLEDLRERVDRALAAFEEELAAR